MLRADRRLAQRPYHRQSDGKLNQSTATGHHPNRVSGSSAPPGRLVGEDPTQSDELPIRWGEEQSGRARPPRRPLQRVEHSYPTLVTASVETCLGCRTGIFAPAATVSECADSASIADDRIVVSRRHRPQLLRRRRSRPPPPTPDACCRQCSCPALSGPDECSGDRALSRYRRRPRLDAPSLWRDGPADRVARDRGIHAPAYEDVTEAPEFEHLANRHPAALGVRQACRFTSRRWPCVGAATSVWSRSGPDGDNRAYGRSGAIEFLLDQCA